MPTSPQLQGANAPISARRLLAIYLPIAAVWAVVVGRNVALDLRFEDAYIVLRYARNLFEGFGFVFNPGERVLGVTTPLHTLIAVIWVALGGENAPALQNLAGVLALLAQGGGVLLLAHRMGFVGAALPAALLTLGNYRLVYLYFGMETHLYAALILLGCWLLLGERVDPTRLGLLLGLAFLVRYDAALLAGLAGLELWRRERRFPVRLTAVFFAVVLPWLVFAQVYFGSILPAPAGAKSGFVGEKAYLRVVLAHFQEAYGNVFRAAMGWAPSGDVLATRFGRAFPIPVLIGLMGAIVRDRRVFWVAALPALHVLTYARLGSDPGFTWHYHLLNPFGFLFFAIGIETLIRGLVGFLRSAIRPTGDGRLRPSSIPRPAAVILVVFACLPPLLHLGRLAKHRYQMDPLTTQLHMMGRWLGQTYPPETSVLQPAIGTLGWTSGLRLVDHAGLVTPGLYFFDDQHCTPLREVVEKHHPDLILESPWAVGDPAALGYRSVHVFKGPFGYEVWERGTSATP